MTQTPATIAPQIFALSLILSVAMLPVLLFAVRGYRQTVRRRTEDRRKGDLVAALRWLLACLAVFTLNFAYLLRTGLVLTGFGDAAAGQVTFFALLSTDFIFVIFANVSIWTDRND